MRRLWEGRFKLERVSNALRLLAKRSCSLPLLRRYRLRYLMIRESTKLIRYFVLLLAASLSAASAHPQDTHCPKEGRPDCPRAVAFFHNFRAAIVRNDRRAVAEMMEYPFLTSINHKRVHISSPARLMQHFDEIFDKGVSCEIEGAIDEDVWGNWQGFTIKAGAIWFDDRIPPGEKVDPKSPDFWTKYSFKVVTVNNDSYYPCLDSGKARK